jgi:DNA-binding PadR family transcriptional regulator
MALRHAVLAALLEGEASGYELSKRFDVSVANFWTATPQQLYRELERLSEEGLIEARVVEQERRPNKRIWTLTPAGDDELYDFSQSPARPPGLRDDLLVKVQAIDAGDAEAVREAIAERLVQARAKLALYDRIRERLLGGVGEDEFLASASRIGPYLTLIGGRMYERQNIRWCERALAVLAERVPSSPGTSNRRHHRRSTSSAPG